MVHAVHGDLPHRVRQRGMRHGGMPLDGACRPRQLDRAAERRGIGGREVGAQAGMRAAAPRGERRRIGEAADVDQIGGAALPDRREGALHRVDMMQPAADALVSARGPRLQRRAPHERVGPFHVRRQLEPFVLLCHRRVASPRAAASSRLARAGCYRSPHLSFCRSTSKYVRAEARTSFTLRGARRMVTSSPASRGVPVWPSKVT